MQIVNITRDQTLAQRAWMANNPFARLLGLLGRKTLPEGSALVLQPCSGVHMFGMRFAVDALYLDGAQRVLHTVSNLAPWRVGPLDPRAECVIEMPVGTLARTHTAVGDEITLLSSDEPLVR